MRTKSLMIILILSVFINVSVLATVGYHYYRNTCLTPAAPCPLTTGGHHLYQALGLSDAQSAKMELLSQSFHSRLITLGSQAEAKRNLLIDMMEHEDKNSGRIEEARREIAVVQDAIQKEVMTHIIQTKEILNAEQQKRFFEQLRNSMINVQFNPAFPINGGNK